MRLFEGSNGRKKEKEKEKESEVTDGGDWKDLGVRLRRENCR